MINLDQLERLYKSYGFETAPEASNVPVFTYQKSRYFGVDIVLTDDLPHTLTEVEKIKQKYSQIGYAIHTKRINSNEEAEIELFKSFFSYDSTTERIKRKYADFKRKQSQQLFESEYAYVESPVEIQNHHEDVQEVFAVIQDRFSSAKAELIIIEAAAGYGKTCTAYEILSRMTDANTNQIPMFTELARNRAAKIFKYILLDEINSEYPSLNYELVTKEIKNGRIPLIIDGFDELLVKSDVETSANDSFEEVESMLDTIGSLLEYKTKIILTTRKTAIFTGVEFENWLSKWHERFQVTRIIIREPRLRDWLGDLKYDQVREKGVPVENLANPVILSFLKNLPAKDYLDLIENSEQLVDCYFSKMLERERTRQNLVLPVERQLDVFRNVVRMLIDLDSTIEEKEFFKEIILDQNRKLIDYARSLYPAVEKPSQEEFVDTLVNHALLDRKGRKQSQIGFVNDFVLGTLIGEIMTENATEKTPKEFSANMVELAVTAFRVQHNRKKFLLWEKIQPIKTKFTVTATFTFDVYLKNRLQQDYAEISVADLSLLNVSFLDHSISASVFINCHFKNCQFNSASLHDTSFINCTFEECRVVDGSFIDDRNGVTVINCQQIDCGLLVQDNPVFIESRYDGVSETERAVLQKLWSISNTRSHHITKLFHAFNGNQRREVNLALKSLEEKGYIKISGFFVRFEMNKIHIIKEILEIKNEVPT
jgi:Zn-finger protein